MPTNRRHELKKLAPATSLTLAPAGKMPINKRHELKKLAPAYCINTRACRVSNAEFGFKIAKADIKIINCFRFSLKNNFFIFKYRIYF